jgi:hypothetical protein
MVVFNFSLTFLTISLDINQLVVDNEVEAVDFICNNINNFTAFLMNIYPEDIE